MNTVIVTWNTDDTRIEFKSGANNFIDNVIRAVARLKEAGYECGVMDLGHKFKVLVL